ncbi:hypothetical protein SDC9_88106 [bioreactor metagenome]|uniref:Uncharacterized protein n=1 Tax=bioreactor metagenome TaxID=1076179 RepID=A0A644ZNP5_9ZZZZ
MAQRDLRVCIVVIQVWEGRGQAREEAHLLAGIHLDGQQRHRP